MKLSHSYSSIKLFENCPLRYYRQRIKKDVVDKGGAASEHGERIHAMLETRLKAKEPLPKEAKKFEPICSAMESNDTYDLYPEKELVLTENLEPTGWWEPDAWLRSKLDVLLVSDTDAIVFDWKTGKRRLDGFQMSMFAAQVFKHYPKVQSVKTSLVWLKTNELDSKTYERSDANKLWADIMQRINRIYDAYEHSNWPAKPSALCGFCPCRHDCDYA